MIIMSGNWDEKHGVCLKHHLPVTPCPQCLSEQDEGVQVMVQEIDNLFLEGEQFLAEQDGEEIPTLKDLLPADHADWLIKRVI